MGSAPFARKFAESGVSAVALATALSHCEEAGGGRRLVLKEHEAYRFARGFWSHGRNSAPSWALAPAPAGEGVGRGPGTRSPSRRARGARRLCTPQGRVPAQLRGSGLAGRDRQPPQPGPAPTPAWSQHSQMGQPVGETKDKNLNWEAERCGHATGCGRPAPGPQRGD